MLFRRKTKVVPATEPVKNLSVSVLKRGGCYLVKEPRPTRSFELFASTVKGICSACTQTEAFLCESIGCSACTLLCPCSSCADGRAQGLCFTTEAPEEIRHKYLLQTTPIFWLSRCGNNSVNPVNLEVIASMINDFLRRSRNPVILLDGTEYLCIMNGFMSVLKFLHNIREWVILHRGGLILPISPLAFDEKERALIERNMEVIEVPAIINYNYL